MRPIFLLLLAVVLSFSCCYSQQGFREGFVVTIVGDTLQGYVIYREGNRVYESCQFKKSVKGDVESYNATELAGYGFTSDKRFLTRIISIKPGIEQKAFLEQLVVGKLSLYRFQQKFFVEKEGRGLAPLDDDIKQITINNRIEYKHSSQFVGMLNSLTLDCNEMRKASQILRLNERSLTSFVEKYNTCVNSSYRVFKGEKRWTKIQFGAIAGMAISNLKVGGGKNYEPVTGKYRASKTPLIGFTFNLISPRVSEHFAVRVDLYYMHPKYFKYNEGTELGSIHRSYMLADFRQLKVSPGVTYNLIERKYTPYIGAGLSLGFAIDPHTYYDHEVVNGNIVKTRSDDLFLIRKHQPGAWAVIGVQSSVGSRLRVFAEARVEQFADINDFSTASKRALTSTVQNFQIAIGATLK